MGDTERYLLYCNSADDIVNNGGNGGGANGK